MNTLTTQTKTASYTWLVAWVIASAVGITVGVAATLPLIWNMSENIARSIPEILVGALGGGFFGFGVGLATGLAQWLVLRLRGESNIRWLTGSLVGGIVGGIVGVAISTQNDAGENSLVTLAAFAVLGAFLGAGQYFAARSTARTIGWIVVSALGLAGGASLSFINSNLEIVGVALGGLIYGFVTAAALWWLNRE